MKYGIGLWVMLALTACSKGERIDQEGSIGNEMADLTIRDLEYERGGWFTAPDSMRGILIKVRVDPDGQRFFLRSTERYGTGDLACPETLFGPAEYKRLMTNLGSLHAVKAPPGARVDSGIATLRIADSIDQSVKWQLESSDSNALNLPVLGGADALESQLNELAKKMACPAPVRQITFERSGQFTAPVAPGLNLVRITIDHGNQSFVYRTYSEFADRAPVACQVTAGAADYAELMANVGRIQQVFVDQPGSADAGVAHVTLVEGRRSTRSTLANSDAYDPDLPVVEAGALEIQLNRYIHDCIGVSQN